MLTERGEKVVIGRAEHNGRRFVIDKLPNQSFGAFVVQERDNDERPIGSQVSFDSLDAAKKHAQESAGVPPDAWEQ